MVWIEAAGPDQRPVVERLIQLYLYDMTEFVPFPVRSDGSFEYGLLDRFWQYPYLFRVEGELAGFALVIADCPITGVAPCWFMAEFFVLRAYRRDGVGARALELILDRHPGAWHIGVNAENRVAGAFWHKVLASRKPRAFDADHDGYSWQIQAFDSAES